MKSAQNPQKSYAILRRRPDDFKVRNQVLLKVPPMLGVVRFSARVKLIHWFIKPYKILEQVG